MHPHRETAPALAPVSSDVFVSPLVVKGPIVVGDQRGRQLGFPTANITMTVRHADIADGVYAGYFTGAGLARAATAVSVGRRMTFHTDGERLLEAHVLDFDGDLYGYFATVELVSYIRPQRRFDGVESLVAQLRDDVASVRRGLLTSPG